jgi:hypothetical protein
MQRSNYQQFMQKLQIDKIKSVFYLCKSVFICGEFFLHHRKLRFSQITTDTFSRVDKTNIFVLSFSKMTVAGKTKIR